jgi:N-methylhydantoinase A
MNIPDTTQVPAWLGIDTGGTFTDFVFFDGQRLHIHKVLSTPQAPERAILQGIREMGVSTAGLQVVHGSTVATNAVLQRKGVRTLYVANRGLGDVLTIGRQARRELYNLQPQPTPPPVPRDCCIEVSARIAADGQRVSELSEADQHTAAGGADTETRGRRHQPAVLFCR